MGCYYVIGLRVDHRRANAAGLQETLTRYGCNIRLRVGLHEAGEGRCSDDGVILLQVCGEQDEVDRIYVVSPRCPHLGCQLEWNPDEKSWDCPCHGSRFDYKGNLIDNPAQEDLCHD